MPDIERFMNLANDVISFYKEEAAHETANYVRATSLVRGLSPVQVLLETVEETVSAYDRVTVMLSGAQTHAAPLVAAWKAFVGGYLTFHMQSERYLLTQYFKCD
ncbi:hypothetical protein OF83DRAFT_379926 [Amylostereum chailletii]|nr:hypothetical protein OF83DRAFT_379926 [Amylostereum chailletii]